MQATGTLQNQDGQTLWSGRVIRQSLLILDDQPSLNAAAANRLWQDLAALLARDLKFQLVNELR